MLFELFKPTGTSRPTRTISVPMYFVFISVEEEDKYLDELVFPDIERTDFLAFKYPLKFDIGFSRWEIF